MCGSARPRILPENYKERGKRKQCKEEGNRKKTATHKEVAVRKELDDHGGIVGQCFDQTLELLSACVDQLLLPRLQSIVDAPGHLQSIIEPVSMLRETIGFGPDSLGGRDPQQHREHFLQHFEFLIH